MNKLSRRFSGLFTSRKQKRQRSYRRLRTESLEGRMLLAGDVFYSLTTNPFDSEDVNGDRQVSPVDVLAVINALNDSGNVAQAEDAGQLGGKLKLDVDVNNDQELSPIDALMVINELNAEGEHGGAHRVAYTPITLATTFTKGSRNLFFDYMDNGSNDQVVRSAGSWITDGFSAGDTFLISDSGQFVDINVGLVLGQDEDGNDVIGTPDADIRVHNNGIYTIQSVTADTITLDRDLITQFPARARLDGDLVEGEMLFDNTASFFRVIDQIGLGGKFLVGTLVEDLRTVDDDGNSLADVRKGPFSAYVDVVFDSALAAPTGTGITDVSFFNGLTAQNNAVLATPGLVDDAGGVAFNNPGNAPTGAGQQLIWATEFMAGDSGGTVVIGSDPADLSPARDTLMFASNFAIPVTEIDFQSASINIVADILAVDDGTFTFDEGSTNNNINVLANDSISSGTGPTITAPVGTTTINGGQLTLVSASSKNGTNYTFTPNSGFSGATGFTYTISNGQGATASADVTINVQAAAPVLVISGPTSRTTNEDTAFTLSGFSITDPEVSPITVNLNTTGSGTLSQTTFQGTLSEVISTLNSVTYTPLTNSTASDTINISASAGTLSDTHAVNVTITPINDPPVNTVPGPQSLFNTETLTFAGNQFQVSDVDASTLEVTLTVTQGTVSINSSGLSTVQGNNTTSLTATGSISSLNTALNSLLYDPIDSFIGDDTLTMTTSDLGNTGSGGTLTDTDTVTLTVTPPQIPFAANDSYSANEGTASFVLSPNPLGNDIQDAGSTITVTGINKVDAQGDLSFTTGASKQNGTVTGSFTYTPPTDPNFFGTETFTYTIEQDPAPASPNLATDTGTITIQILPVNDGPINTVPGSLSVNEDNTLSFSAPNLITIQDIDAGSGDLTVTLTVGNGTLNVSSGGASVANNNSGSVKIDGTVSQINNTLGGLTYSPDVNFFGSDVLTINTNDNGNTGGGALSDNDTVNITINPINDAPTIVVPGAQSFLTDFDNLFTSSPNPFQISDIDAGGNDVQVDLTIGDGTLTISAQGGASVSNNGSSSVRITGSVADLNSSLANGVTYRTSTDGDKTLTATVSDLGNTGGGNVLTASATVDVEVLDFVPIDIVGRVFQDFDHDGNKDSDEPAIEGVHVTLSGTDFQGNPVNHSIHSDALGFYSFLQLRPNAEGQPYTITQQQPIFIQTGPAGDHATVNLDVRGNVTVSGGSLNFGAGDFVPQFADIWDLFDSSDTAPRDSGILFAVQGTSQDWSIFYGSSWDMARYRNARLSLDQDGHSGLLTVFDSQLGRDRTANVSVDDGTLTYRGRGADRVYRVMGGSELLGSVAQAEGESVASGNATTDIAAYTSAVDSIFDHG